MTARGAPLSHIEDAPAQDEASAGAPGADGVGPLAGMSGYALRRAQLVVFDSIIKKFSAIDLRPAQYSVLVMLKHRPGLKQSDMAALLGIQRANFVVLIDALERRGLAERRRSQRDRRSYALHLTPAGERLLERANTLETEHETRIEQILGVAGRAELLRLLHRLADRL